MIFHTTRRVEFSDTDMAGIVHFARFFSFMESAEHEFLRSLGLSVMMEIDGLKLGFPRVGANADYLQPARFEEELTITVAIEKLGKKSITYQFQVLREETILAIGSITTVCCRMLANHQLESFVIPELIRERLSPYIIQE